jgi:hypothetical protein
VVRLADLGPLVVEAEHGDCSAENIHGTRIPGGSLEEINDSLRNGAATGEILLEGIELGLPGKPAMVEKIDHFLVAAVLYQIVDMIAEVGETAVKAFYVGEDGFVGGDSFEAFGVIGHV